MFASFVAAAVAAGAWVSGPPLPVARTEVAGASFSGGIAVVGGYLADGRSTGRADAYRPGRGWSRLPSLPARVNHASAASVDGRLYVLGGYGARRSAFVLVGRKWRKLPRLPEPRAAAGAAVVGKTIYVVGGVGTRGLARHALAFDTRRGRWRAVPGPTPREHLAAASLAGVVYAVGGRTAGYDTNLDLVESWRPGSRTWSRLPALPHARGGTGVAVAGGMLVSVGGEEPAGTIASVYSLRPGDASWTRLPDLPTPRHGLAVVGVDRTVYAIGGGPQPGLHVSAANEALTTS